MVHKSNPAASFPLTLTSRDLDLSLSRDLARRFSLDWIPDERLLRVINEKNVHVIATLHVARSYPAPGSVTLRRLEGFPAAEGARTAAETLRPPPGEGGADPTLEIWLNFLNEQFRTTC